MIARVLNDRRHTEQDESRGENRRDRRRRHAARQQPVLRAHQNREGGVDSEERGSILVEILPQIEGGARLDFRDQECGSHIEEHGREEQEKKREEVPIPKQAEIPHRPPQEDMPDEGERHPEQMHPIKFNPAARLK